MEIDLRKDNNIKVLRGKYKGRTGYIITEITKHPQGSKKRYSVRIQTGWGWKTLLMNVDGFEIVK